MAKLGGIFIDVRAKTDKYKRDLANAKTLTKQAAVKIQKQLDSINFKAVGAATLAFSVAVGFGMKKAIDAASNLEETVGKFDVVFKKHGQQAEAMAKVLVKSYAMSTREAKQYLSSVQDLLVPMGMSSDKAIMMSNAVVKLAADLGSFNNLPTSTVMLDIQSALVGNFETMKKYGVVLNETVIKQEALNLKLWDGKGMVDANTKAQIAFRLMLKGSAAAIGDQQRTMGSYANQMKQLHANIENIAATIGGELLPQVTAWINQINIAIERNPKIIEQVGEFTKNILDLASAMGDVVLFGVEFYNVFVSTAQAIGLASTGIISWKEALLDGVDAVKRFRLEQEGVTKSINSQTPGYSLYNGKEPPLGIVNVPGDITPVAKKGDSLQKARIAAIQEEERLRAEKWQAEIEFSNAQIEKEKELYEQKLETQKEFNLSYEEIGLDRFELERLQVERMTEIYKKAGVNRTKISELTSDKLKKIAQAEQQAKLTIYQGVAGGIADTFQMIAQAGGKHSKEAFKMYKAFAMAQALIAGAQAVLAGLAAPWPLNMIMPIVAGAAAAVKIASIANQQPPSYDQGGISNAQGIYQTGNIAEAHIPIPSGGKIPVKMGEGSQGVNIIMNNPVFQDLETQRQTMAQISEVVTRQIAPGAIIENYQNDGAIRSMVKGGM
jgi:hypothetical protein